MLIVIAASGNIRKMGALFFSYISYRFTRNMFFISVQEVGIDKKNKYNYAGSPAF